MAIAMEEEVKTKKTQLTFKINFSKITGTVTIMATVTEAKARGEVKLCRCVLPSENMINMW